MNNLIKHKDARLQDCNCKDLEYLQDRYETYIQEYDDKAAQIIKNLLKESKMRCSEHYINIVKEKNIIE